MYGNEITDTNLVKLLTRGDQNAFRLIYDRYFKKLMSMAIYKTNDRVVAEELVQEIFVSIWEKREQNNIENLESYLFVSLKYAVIGHIRKNIKDRVLVDAEGLEIGTQPVEKLTAEALQQAIHHAVEQLPEKTQVVFKMSRFDELPHKEIAAFLEISEKAVEYHITQALRFLKAELHDFI